jgi:phage terminase large subunit-like protein
LNACRNRRRRKRLLASLSENERLALLWNWQIWARDDQLPPAGEWTTWLLLGGRGAGKTRAGAEWVRGLALGLPGVARRPVGRIDLVGETLEDVRSVMIEGESGILAVHPPHERPRFEISKRRLVWESGAVAQMFSGSRPASLRGPQFGAAWCDELAKWRWPKESFDMLQFGLRLGERPRQLITTTPRPLPLLRELLATPAVAVDRVSTRANAAFLAPDFISRMEERYGGSRLGRQELEAEMLEQREDALWSRELLDSLRTRKKPELARVVVAVDPPASSGEKSDRCGIVIAALDEAGRALVLADETRERASPLEWARAAVRAFHEHEADRIIAEVNQGGEMVEAIIRQVDDRAPVRTVRARRGKYLRAEPVAALYEQGRVRHLGFLPELEDEMCDFGPDGLSTGRSPDRLDALVWAISDLMLMKNGQPRVRAL